MQPSGMPITGRTWTGGSTAVQAALADAPADPAGVLNTAAQALIRTVGGASGPLFGTFFLRAAAAAAGRSELDAAAVTRTVRSRRGRRRAEERSEGKEGPGDKTMLDALLPAIAAMRTAFAGGADIGGILRARAPGAAEEGMRSTIAIQARKGTCQLSGRTQHRAPGSGRHLNLAASPDGGGTRMIRNRNRLARPPGRGRMRTWPDRWRKERCDWLPRAAQQNSDNPIGTDASRVLEAIESVYSEESDTDFDRSRECRPER